jgi:hypothetical protein
MDRQFHPAIVEPEKSLPHTPQLTKFPKSQIDRLWQPLIGIGIFDDFVMLGGINKAQISADAALLWRSPDQEISDGKVFQSTAIKHI